MEKDNRELSDAEKKKKIKENKIFSWFLSSMTVFGVIIAIYLIKHPELIHPNKNKDSDEIKINCDECKKKILELTKENDSLKVILFKNK